VEKLFGSKTRTKLLELFTSNPNRAFYVREITRKIDEQINSVRRELANLLSLGIITSDSTNNRLYYEINQKNDKYEALRELFTGKRVTSSKKATKSTKSKSKKSEVSKEKQQKEPLVDAELWEKVGNIYGIIYSGVLTRDSLSPIDVLVVGDVPTARAESAVSDLEEKESKELRYAVMSLDEWEYRRGVNDKFWSQVMAAKNQIVLDKNSIFEQK